jgi:integrase
LHTSTDRLNSREFTAAYTAAQIEVEGILLRAEQQPGQAPALTERDRFGLMREMLLAYEMAGASGSDLAHQFGFGMQPKPGETKEQWAESMSRADQQLTEWLLNQVLKRLRLRLTSEQQASFLAEFDQHKDQMLQTRSREIKEYNFNSVGGILERLPEPPKPVVTWETLRDAWINRRGGKQLETGTGLSEESVHRADKHWGEIKKLTGVHSPSDVTKEMLRQWMTWQRERGLVAGTQKSNLAIIKAIFKVGLLEGLLPENVAENLAVSAPLGHGYQPFSPDQIREIFRYTEKPRLDYHFWLPRLGLYTGARIEELAQLTVDDVIEEKGVKALYLKHDPTGTYPKQLKGGLQSERQVPIHPWILEQGFAEFIATRQKGRIFLGSGQGSRGTIGPAASRWHKLCLEKLGIWKGR